MLQVAVLIGAALYCSSMGELTDSCGEMRNKGRGLLNKVMMAVLRRGS